MMVCYLDLLCNPGQGEFVVLHETQKNSVFDHISKHLEESWKYNV